MTSSPPPHPLISHLIALANHDNRRALATLRRSISPHCEATAYPIVAPFFPRDTRPQVERAMLTVAGLFALHPVHAPMTLGLALRRVATRRQSESIEGRFVALLDAAAEDVAPHLRQLVALLATDGVGVDWNDLLRALESWEFEDNWARRRWARDFWANPSEPAREMEEQP